MNSRYALLLAVLLFTSNFSFAQSIQQDQTSQGLNMPVGFDLGLPGVSAADPKYVAQEKFVDEMTTVYTWIAGNSTQFVQGCREDRSTLVDTITTVIQQAQEASTVCMQFEAEAAACDPDLFCSRFESGMPIPPGMDSVFREAGIDPDNLSVNDITQDVAIKICKAQAGKETDKVKERQEKMKENLRSQIPEFRQKCEQMKERMESEGSYGTRRPAFVGPGPQQGPPQGQQYGPPQGNYGPQQGMPHQQPYEQQPFNPPQGGQYYP